MALLGKKLKRRLEDLERRAGSSDEAESEKQGSTSPSSTGNASLSKSTKRQSSSKPSKSQQHHQLQTPPKPISHGQFTPPMDNTDELMFAHTYDDRERSHTPPMFAYSTYPAPDELLMNPYAHAQPYASAGMTTAESYPNYLAAATVPSTLPSMTHFSDAVKRDSYPSDDGLNPYMAYGFGTGVDMSAHVPSPYDQSNPHVSYARHLPLPRGPRR